MAQDHSQINLLRCPRCEGEVVVAAADQVDGRLMRCSHCLAESALTRDWDEHTDTYHWTLIDPATEYDDESI